jgi:hypothetical protein
MLGHGISPGKHRVTDLSQDLLGSTNQQELLKEKVSNRSRVWQLDLAD